MKFSIFDERGIRQADLNHAHKRSSRPTIRIPMQTIGPTAVNSSIKNSVSHGKKTSVKRYIVYRRRKANGASCTTRVTFRSTPTTWLTALLRSGLSIGKILCVNHCLRTHLLRRGCFILPLLRSRRFCCFLRSHNSILLLYQFL